MRVSARGITMEKVDAKKLDEAVKIWLCLKCGSEQPNTNDDTPCPNCGYLYVVPKERPGFKPQ